MLKITFWSCLILGCFLIAASSAPAAQTSNGRGNVVHSRRAPVIMHRTFPPYTGIHVYHSGRRSR